MKKILSAAALFLTLPMVFTGCGENRDEMNSNGGHFEDYDYGNNADGTHKDDNRVDNSVNDAVDGAESAVDDVIDGAGDAVNDIVDGFDGDSKTTATSGKTTVSTSTAVTTE